MMHKSLLGRGVHGGYPDTKPLKETPVKASKALPEPFPNSKLYTLQGGWKLEDWKALVLNGIGTNPDATYDHVESLLNYLTKV